MYVVLALRNLVKSIVFASVSAQGFDLDNLYLHFFIDLPKSKLTETTHSFLVFVCLLLKGVGWWLGEVLVRVV